MIVTIVGYLLNLACWERMYDSLLNSKNKCGQNETSELCDTRTWGKTLIKETIKDLLIKFFEKTSNLGVCLCVWGAHHAKANTVSQVHLNSHKNAVDGNDMSTCWLF